MGQVEGEWEALGEEAAQGGDDPVGCFLNHLGGVRVRSLCVCCRGHPHPDRELSQGQV